MLTTTLNGIERYMQTIFTKKAYFYDDYYYSLCFGNGFYLIFDWFLFNFL